MKLIYRKVLIINLQYNLTAKIKVKSCIKFIMRSKKLSHVGAMCLQSGKKITKKILIIDIDNF